MKKLVKFIFVFLSLAFIGGLIGLGVIISISFDLPQINSLADYNPPIPSKIMSRDGEVLMELSHENRELASMEEIPKTVLHAFLAAEDDNFYSHHGVDYIGILRALVKNIKEGRIVQGASTITQQVAKSLLLSSERTITRKIKDVLLAQKIEEKFTKDEILYLYLNQVYLGGGYYGVKSAVKGYFGKELSEATVAESALIAGLLVAPGRYSPYVNPQYAKTRQRYVLKRMFETQKITQAEYENALNENIRMQTRQYNDLKAGYFSDWIRQRLMDAIGKDELYTNGYTIITTLDWDLQKKAEEEVSEGVRAIDKRQGYKGVLGNLTSEETATFLVEQRKKLYQDASNYFTFYSDGSVTQEFEYQEEELTKLFEAETQENEKVKANLRKYFEPGILEGEEVFNLVKYKKRYEAIVTMVSDSQRMIYASIAGIKVMIPYEEFRWAHERHIDEERKFFSYVTRPSTIVKSGDKILVQILSTKPMGAWGKVHSDFKKMIKDNDLIREMQAQKYYLALLDQEPEVQGALLSISPQTGEILSLVGGEDFSRSQFNRVVQSNRQPGSAFKPLIFATGLENGYTPASILLDSPQALGGVDSTLNWKPRNYEGSFEGEVTFRKALEHSKNVPTIKLAQDVGVEKIINFVERIKVKTKLPHDLSISLGSFGVNLLDLVKAYAIFPNGGRTIKLKSIINVTDRTGKVYHLENINLEDERKEDAPAGPSEVVAEVSEVKEVSEDENIEETNSEVEPEKVNPFLVNLNEEQVYDPRLAYIMTNLLRGVVEHGTGRSARDVGSFVGGKTGTTNNYVDAWFLGFSSRLVTGVWTGFDDNKTLGWGETGAKSALQIWRGFMKLGVQKYGEGDFKIPGGIINVAINPETGKIAGGMSGKSMMESFVEGTEPGAIKEETDDSTQDLSNTILEDEDYYISQ